MLVQDSSVTQFWALRCRWKWSYRLHFPPLIWNLPQIVLHRVITPTWNELLEVSFAVICWEVIIWVKECVALSVGCIVWQCLWQKQRKVARRSFLCEYRRKYGFDVPVALRNLLFAGKAAYQKYSAALIDPLYFHIESANAWWLRKLSVSLPIFLSRIWNRVAIDVYSSLCACMASIKLHVTVTCEKKQVGQSHWKQNMRRSNNDEGIPF